MTTSLMQNVVQQHTRVALPSLQAAHGPRHHGGGDIIKKKTHEAQRSVSFHSRRKSFRVLVPASSPSPPGEVSGMEPELKEAVEEFLEKNKVVLFMKGTKQFPQCGFSNTCVQILNVMDVPYETINILEDERLRQGMKAYSQWPTFPQVYINAEFVGGCDIMIESYQSGELREMLEVGINS